MEQFKPIAVIGYGCVFPGGGKDADAFWGNVLSGANGIEDVSKKYWKEDLYFNEDKHVEDKTYCKKGGVVSDYEFPMDNALELGFLKDDLTGLNKTQKMTLDTIIQAIRQSGLELKDLSDANFFVGNMLGDADVPDNMLKNRVKEIEKYIEASDEYKNLEIEKKKQLLELFEEKFSGRFEEADNENLIPSSLLYRLKNLLKINGHGCIVDGACSGSGLVIDEAIKSIQYGPEKMCVTSAVLGNMVVTGNIGFAKIGGLSETSSFPLDERAGGLIPGEGAGTIILKDLKCAIEDGNRILGVIRGTGVASDGKGQSIYAPSSRGQLKAMKKSIAVSGLKGEDVDYIETHATGTKVGDKVEIETIKQFFKSEGDSNRKVPIGSVKSQIGHAFSAAGMANMVKILEAMKHEIIPPTHNYNRPPQEVDLGNLYVNTKQQYWKRRNDHTPRRAMLNAFGFGGINANVFLEEYIPDYHKNLVKEQKEALHDGEYAIVGIGCLDHKGNNYKEWKDKITQKADYSKTSISKFYPEEAKGLYEDMKGYLISDFKFPFMKYKVPPKILDEIDISQQYALVAAGEAIEDYGKDKIDGDKTGVYVGTMMGLSSALKTDLRVRHVEYLDALDDCEKDMGVSLQDIKKTITEKIHSYLIKVKEDTLPGYMDNIIAGRISNFYDFSGSNAVYDKDIASFEAALYQGLASLNKKENNLIIVGGVHGNMLPETFANLEKMGCAGSIPAEGAAFFAIKRVEDIAPDDNIYAKISGIKHSVNAQKCDFTNKPFYFGADGAFKLLDKVSNIRTDSKPEVIESTNMFGETYSYPLCGRDEHFAAEEKKTIEIGNISYYAADTKQELLNNMIDHKEFSTNRSRFKLVITYNSLEELENKKKLLIKSIGGGI
ncbi:beta-ketoacyl synthase N-terminal-like domain-containing protein [Butyrivibrio sp. M55]|uniref:beta-ketoacyl synthase N-terminal-like domain-containing protein n=1 Tax=Butyrivibrio sp. M55 TaxID=1855323 RepID=UPI0008F43943|nr:beta-ketoacyl synthase N-terminal-like domain-containing protein [Butyrivibrio sp. M55]SFU45507.1 Beta-ketoacyl synthase, N-terminal domain [Butyrivibrio sp. M55]